LAIAGFFAVEYMGGRSVDPLAPVICSWVAIVAPLLLAIGWVIKKQYLRTFMLAVLVAATRVCFEASLSKFMKIAGWFLIGAIVLVLIVALAARWMRRSAAAEPQAVAAASGEKREVPVAQPVRAEAAAPGVLPQKTPAPPARETGPKEAEAGRCDKCGAELLEGATFCRECGAKST
jgi:hypothetical protein